MKYAIDTMPLWQMMGFTSDVQMQAYIVAHPHDPTRQGLHYLRHGTALSYKTIDRQRIIMIDNDLSDIVPEGYFIEQCRIGKWWLAGTWDGNDGMYVTKAIHNPKCPDVPRIIRSCFAGSNAAILWCMRDSLAQWKAKAA